MEKKQCSIDWLIDQIKNVENQKNLTGAQWIDVVEQAKAMHKDEIVEAYYMGDRYSCACYDHTTEEDGEQYYNEEFGGDNE